MSKDARPGEAEFIREAESRILGKAYDMFCSDKDQEYLPKFYAIAIIQALAREMALFFSKTIEAYSNGSPEAMDITHVWTGDETSPSTDQALTPTDIYVTMLIKGVCMLDKCVDFMESLNSDDENGLPEFYGRLRQYVDEMVRTLGGDMKSVLVKGGRRLGDA